MGHEEGEIVIFDVKKPGRESEAKEAARYKNKVMSREVCWSNRRGELYVGNEDGTVTIWDAKLNTPICRIIIFLLKMFLELMQSL